MTEIIQLLMVENTVNRSKAQQLKFLIRVMNLDYHKQVDVVWRGTDSAWQKLAARYQAQADDNQEIWQAQTVLPGKSGLNKQRSIQFALRLISRGQEYWDNNLGRNYASLMNSGIQLAEPLPLQNLSFNHRRLDAEQAVTIRVALNPLFPAHRLVIHWTIDDWRHIHQTSCRPGKPHRQTQTRICTAHLKIGDAYRLQYAICYETQTGQIWDNNGGKNYVLSREPLKVLVLNLHCYQEEQQDRKFSKIAKAINELDADVVCLQEVAEHWNHGHGDWPSNSAHIIQQRLKRDFHLYSDWSHLGFDKYREGVAILSRFPLLHRQSRYVSENCDIYSIHSRKVVMAQIHAPYIGPINIFSAHLSWWEDGFQQQFQDLSHWADSLADSAVATLLCGDFNITAGTTGYQLVVNSQKYDDQYLAANAQGLFDKIFRVNDPHWRDYPADDYRIDYIFMNRDGGLRVTSARTLFTESDYGRVSDHCGYLMSFEPKI